MSSRRRRKNPAFIAATLLITAACCSPAPAQDDRTMLLRQKMDFLLSYEKDQNGPGESMLIQIGDSVVYRHSFGLADLKTGEKFTEHTVANLGSISKTFVAYGILKLREEGKLSLDDGIIRYFPDFKNKEIARKVRIRHLLTHTSGLRATLPLREAPDSAAALRMVLTTVPVAPPGTRMVYSDLNAILLGEIVRHVSGQTLDAFVTRAIYAPLGLDQQMLFRPPKRLVPRIAPTNLWRGHPIAGVVNDPSAGMLGGVSGNAGVFATARGLARFAQFMLNEGALPDRPRLLKKETVHQFTQIAVPARRGVSARTLGWEALPTGEETSSAGTIFGPHSFGHTGWTGTSLWIDPDRDLFVLLLTNRAYAPRLRGSFTKLKEVRGRVADAAARAIDALGR